MSNLQGWISLHRKIQDNFLYPKNRPFSKFEAWIDLLLMANHKDKQVVLKSTVYNVKRGQIVRSMKTLAQRWKWSRSKVKRYLKMIQECSMIELKTDTITTTITVCNYDSYQDPRTSNEHQTNIKRTSNEHQTNINNNDNNSNNDNNRATDELNLQNVLAYFDEREMKSEGYKCWNWYDADAKVVNGEYVWVTNKGKVIKSWKRACGQWISRMSAKQKEIARLESKGYDLNEKPTEKINEYSKYCDEWGIDKKVACYLHKETGKTEWAVGGITFHWLKQLVEEWPEYVKHYDEEFLWRNWKDHWWDAAVRNSKEFIAKSEKI